jgi:hypothetical protein
VRRRARPGSVPFLENPTRDALEMLYLPLGRVHLTCRVLNYALKLIRLVKLEVRKYRKSMGTIIKVCEAASPSS